MKTIAIIPARGGSKGIKNKNIVLIAGKPLIAWSIENLKTSASFDEIIVSSDSDEILGVAAEYGASVFKRIDPEISNDVVMPDAAVEEILRLHNSPVKGEDNVFMVQCTSPLTKPKTFSLAKNALIDNPESTVFSGVEDHGFLWRTSRKYSGDPTPVSPANHDAYIRLGRQFYNDTFFKETGGFYGFKARNFLLHNHRFFGKAVVVQVSSVEASDIDDETDLKLAETLLNKTH
ncbi:MAG: acylneuraminate cytidylyltransferase family protein [Pseudomonadota bacterium]|nr:acylneuraminate cytidylyltransferase family protein [Pseudomonadota bacterium]